MPVRAQGVDRLAKALAAVAEEATDANVHRAATLIVLQEAKARAPRSSGKLQKSGKVRASKNRADVIFGGGAIRYAGPVHFGDPKPRKQGGFVRPNPFLYDAADKRLQDVIAVFDRRLSKALQDNGLT